MRTQKGFTLTEILVVIVIVGILVALTLPNYSVIREKSLNREARTSLALIQAAEKIYRLEQGFYYPYGGATENNASVINSYLKLNLPKLAAGSSSKTLPWSISVNSASGVVTATRVGVGKDDRQWAINFPGDAVATVPTCSGGTACN